MCCIVAAVTVTLYHLAGPKNCHLGPYLEPWEGWKHRCQHLNLPSTIGTSCCTLSTSGDDSKQNSLHHNCKYCVLSRSIVTCTMTHTCYMLRGCRDITTGVFLCQLHWLPVVPPSPWLLNLSSLFLHILSSGFSISHLFAKTYCLQRKLVSPPHNNFFENLKAKTWKLLRVLLVIPLILQWCPFLFCMAADPLVCCCYIAMIWVRKEWSTKFAEGFSIDF